MSIFLKYILGITPILLLFGCNKCKRVPLDNVHIRIENNMGIDLEKVTFGSRMFKGNNHYRSCSFTTRIMPVKNGELTNYIQTSGKHLGYNFVRIAYRNEEGRLMNSVSFRDVFNVQLQNRGAVKSVIRNVFNDKEIEGWTLPDGHYTFKIQGFSKTGNTIVVDVVRD